MGHVPDNKLIGLDWIGLDNGDKAWIFLPRDATQSAVGLLLRQSCLSVRPSVCLSVTLRYREHIGWNSSKIISPSVSLRCPLFVDPNTTDLLQGERLKV